MKDRNIIVVILIAIAVLSIYSIAAGENFCNCAGMGWKTPKPTYYVYRPGDVSQYITSPNVSSKLPTSYSTNQYSLNKNPKTTTILPRQNLGWRTGMPYDYFSKNLNIGQNWTSGSDPNPAINSSVPMVAMQQLNNCASNVGPNVGMNMVPKNNRSLNNGGYVKNYGSPTSFVSGPSGCPTTSSGNNLKFVRGPSGYPNMLSDGTPETVGFAGKFTSNNCSKACPTANAYNLGVGVL